MPRRRHLVSCLVVGLIVLIAGMTSDARVAAAFIVAGQVIDAADGTPIAGASVELRNVGAAAGTYYCRNGVTPPEGRDCEDHEIPYVKPVTVETDAEGSFSFGDVPRTQLAITARKSGYYQPVEDRSGNRSGPGWEAPLTADIANVVLKLEQPLPGSISGTVADADGRPIADALVLWHRLGGDAVPEQQLAAGSALPTKPDGTFRFVGLAPGFYYLTASPGAFGHTVPPASDADGNPVGYVPLRYPAATPADPQPHFRLPGGTEFRAELRFAAKSPLHHVTGTAVRRGVDPSKPWLCRPDEILDRDGNRYDLKLPQTMRGERFEAWLPDGRYEVRLACTLVDPAAPRGNSYRGSAIIEVAGADLADVAIQVGMPDAPVELSIEVTPAVCPTRDTLCAMEGDHSLSHFHLHKMTLDPFDSAGLIDLNVYRLKVGKFRATVPPGRYAVDIGLGPFTYAKSITSGAVDLNAEDLVIKPEGAVPPIRLVLGRSTQLFGTITKNGAPALGCAYVIPTARRVEFFGPPFADCNIDHFDGRHYPPGKYIAFATARALGIDLRDAQTLASFVQTWRAKIQRVELAEDKPATVELEIIDLQPATNE